MFCGVQAIELGKVLGLQWPSLGARLGAKGQSQTQNSHLDFQRGHGALAMPQGFGIMSCATELR
jgi:hypothetical protein